MNPCDPESATFGRYPGLLLVPLTALTPEGFSLTTDRAESGRSVSDGTDTWFLLTRHWRDTAAGIELSYWAWTPSGALRLLFPTEQAVCFVPRNSLLPGHNNYVRRPLALADLQGNPVDGLYFERHAELRELRQQAAAAGVELLESDIKPVDRFLMERFVTASFTARGKSIDQGGFQQMIAPQIRSASIQPRLNYISLDIETDGVAGEVLSIALVGCNQEQILMQGSAEELTRGLPVCWYANEQALLSAFFRRISRLIRT